MAIPYAVTLNAEYGSICRIGMLQGKRRACVLGKDTAKVIAKSNAKLFVIKLQFLLGFRPEFLR